MLSRGMSMERTNSVTVNGVSTVLRRALLVVLALVVWGGRTSAQAQEWARKMFKETSHDFGVVARGAKVEHRFEFQNIYKEPIHIAGVRTSCGCTTPEVTVQTLKTWEKGEVVATFNTRSFLGARSATLTVTIDQPYYAEVQLFVSGYIRGDVVFDPGQVNFGEVDQGAGAEQTVNVNYAGRSNWQIVDVLSANRHFEVELNETNRRNGNVSYRMTVRLKPDAPPGYINDQLTIVTNDGYRESIPLAVEGRVRSALTVSPSPLILGILPSGERVEKKLLIRAKTPFRILKITSDVEGFAFDVDADVAKTTHFVPLSFTASKSGTYNATIHIETDLANGVQADVTASAEVKADEQPVQTDAVPE